MCDGQENLSFTLVKRASSSVNLICFSTNSVAVYAEEFAHASLEKDLSLFCIGILSKWLSINFLSLCIYILGYFVL
jgi:hypothetical protein